VAGGLLLAGGTGLAAAGELVELVAGYLRAAGEQAPGTVVARAYLEPTRPTSGRVPRPDVSVVLVPYSPSLAADLDAVKAGLRDSIDAYVRAVGRVESARVDYERALVAAGGGVLVRSDITDAEGGARLADLPAGDWLLLAWREDGHVAKRFRLREQDAKRYPNVPTNVTYSVVTYWRSRIAVKPDQTVEVAMTDRNAWMTAPRQERGNPVPPPGSRNEPGLRGPR
jgi:hypothetical protein